MAGGRDGPRTSLRTARRTAGLSLPLLGLSLASALGTAMAPVLLTTHPLLLVALSPRSVFLLAAADRVEPAALLPVAAARLIVADPFHFALGRLHGDRVTSWVGRRFPGARPVHDLLSRLLHRAGAPAVAVSPTGKVLALAGALGLPPYRVGAADLAGTVVYVFLLVGLGRSTPVALWVLGALAVSAAVVAGAVQVRHLAAGVRWARTVQPGAWCGALS